MCRRVVSPASYAGSVLEADEGGNPIQAVLLICPCSSATPGGRLAKILSDGRCPLHPVQTPLPRVASPVSCWLYFKFSGVTQTPKFSVVYTSTSHTNVHLGHLGVWLRCRLRCSWSRVGPESCHFSRAVPGRTSGKQRGSTELGRERLFSGTYWAETGECV